MIEVGEYIRTKSGLIGTVISVDKDIDWLETTLDRGYVYPYCEFKKHSTNIIDLIECGDIIEILCNELTQETNTIRIKDIEQLKTIKQIPKYIKSIVTKEQFAKAEYKIKEDK